MSSKQGFAVLNGALPVLRLLGVDSVSVTFDSTNDPLGIIHFPQYDPPLLAEPDGLQSLLTNGVWHVLPDGWADGASFGSVTIHVPGSACTISANEEQAEQYPRAAEKPVPNSHDLAAFVRSLSDDPAGHLALADRLEELFGPCCAAAAFRASVADGSPGNLSSLRAEALVWRWLDCGVMLCLSRLRSWHHDPDVIAFAVGLLFRCGGEPPRCWRRWLHDDSVEARRLAAEMGCDASDK